MIKQLWAKITRAGKDDQTYPVQQATYLGRVTDAFVLFPYGMHANLPADQLGLMLDERGRVFMGTSAVGRIAVEDGEVVFYHPGTLSKLHFKANGDIDITAGKVTITGDLEVTGDTALGATVTSNGVDISDTHKHSGVETGAGNTGNPI